MATDSPLLTDGQRKLAGFAIALFALLASVALLVSVVWALAWLVGRFGGVLWPLATARSFCDQRWICSNSASTSAGSPP